MKPLALYTIAPSHYCEKARWALDRAGLRFVERARAPLFHLASTVRRGSRTVPMLLAGDRVLRDSTEILRWIDDQLPEVERLFPAHGPEAEAVAQFEDRMDEKLGPHVRRWCYGHLLDHKDLTLAALSPQLRSVERVMLERTIDLVAAFMKQSLKITPEGIERSLGRIQQIFAEVDALLEKGKPFLFAGRLTAADLTLAALTGPILAIPEYGAPLPAIEKAPPAMRREVEIFRKSRTGEHVASIYRRFRTQRVPSVMQRELRPRA